MKQKVTIGVVCLARTTYDYLEARNLYTAIRTSLKTVEDVQWEFLEELVIDRKSTRLNSSHV